MGFFDDPANQPPSSGVRPGGYGSNGPPTSQPGPVQAQPAPTQPTQTGAFPGTKPGGGATTTGTLPGGTGGADQAGNQALWDQAGHDIKTFISLYAQKHNISPQQIPSVTNQFADALKSVGVNADYEGTDEYGRSAGIKVNGLPYKIINGSGQWMYDTYQNAEGAPANYGMPGYVPGQGGGGSLWATVPTEAEARDMPGIQFALDENNRRMMAGAAAKGTLLNGRTQQAIGESNIQAALQMGYLPLAQLQNQVKGQNAGNLLDLSKLGLNATSTGNA
jgi:hypothetical protein